jgi:orotate phosphoribosyltransferase
MIEIPDLKNKKEVWGMKQKLIQCFLRRSFVCKVSEGEEPDVEPLKVFSFDAGEAFLEPQGLFLMSALILESLIGCGSQYIGAFNAQGISIAQLSSLLSHLYQKHYEFEDGFPLFNSFFVFDEIRKIERPGDKSFVPKGSPIVLVQDVCKDGKNVLRVIQRAEKEGWRVEAIRFLFDYEEGGVDMLQGYLGDAQALVSLSDCLE